MGTVSGWRFVVNQQCNSVGVAIIACADGQRLRCDGSINNIFLVYMIYLLSQRLSYVLSSD